MSPHTRADLKSLPGYVAGKSVPGAIKLASNEITHGPLPSVSAAIAKAAESINRYPDAATATLTELLATRAGVAPENVRVGCGSVSLIGHLVQATCGPGDEVLFAWRSFESYPLATRVAGAVPVQVPLTAEHAHDLDAMAAAITQRNRLIFVCNPNNPTGTTVSEAALRDFLARVPESVVVALDEAYFEYYRDSDVTGSVIDGVPLTHEFPNLLVLRTFSKAYGLAGLRIGYAIGSAEVMEALGKVTTPFEVNAIAQAAAIASLEAQAELLERTNDIVAERTRVGNALRGAGYDVPPTQSNFVWLPLGDKALEFAADSATAKVIVRPFAGDGVRVTIGDADQNDVFLAFATAWISKVSAE